MKNQVLEFLKEKYDQRIDHPQPLISTDDATIQHQLALINKKIVNTKYAGLVLIFTGVLWMMWGAVSFSINPIDAGHLFRIGLGLVGFISGLIMLHQRSSLETKKVILETIVFINQTA